MFWSMLVMIVMFSSLSVSATFLLMFPSTTTMSGLTLPIFSFIISTKWFSCLTMLWKSVKSTLSLTYPSELERSNILGFLWLPLDLRSMTLLFDYNSIDISWILVRTPFISDNFDIYFIVKHEPIRLNALTSSVSEFS